MSRRDPIREVVVVGGGISGWSAAGALKRRMPWLEVAIVPVPPPADALADRMIGTLPSILGFHADLGLGDADAVIRAGSGYRLGTRFVGWAADPPDYVHAYGRYGEAFGASSFHLHWVRSARAGEAAPFDRHAPAAMLGRANRFAPAEPGGLFAGYEHGLTLDLPRYAAMLRAFAAHVGVREHPAEFRGVRLDGDSGFIAAVLLEGGGELAADLFVDATGPGAALRTSVGGERQDWRSWLRCDRMLVASAPPPAELPALDTVTAVSAGWRWEAASPAARSLGVVYCSGYCSDADAAALLGAEPDHAPITIGAGAWAEPWARNCVAIGDAAVAIEPLEWTNLHLAHSAIDRIVAMLPDRSCAPVELAEYNRQALAEAERVRDFVALHYAVADRPEPFWQDAAAAELPPSLAHSLALFRERGRLPVYAEETFARDSWLAVLLGQGVLPRRVDPLTDAVPPAQASAAMAALRQAIADALPGLPTLSQFLALQTKQISR